MREFPETWTLQKITDAGNHKSATITRGHDMGKTDLLASPTRAAESPADRRLGTAPVNSAAVRSAEGILQPHWSGVRSRESYGA